MSEFYDELMQGLKEAIEIERGERKGRKTVYHITPVKKYDRNQIRQIRNASGMTQIVFAEYLGVSPKTVEAWEKGTNHPTGSACRLISILEEKKENILPFVKKEEYGEG